MAVKCSLLALVGPATLMNVILARVSGAVACTPRLLAARPLPARLLGCSRPPAHAPLASPIHAGAASMSSSADTDFTVRCQAERRRRQVAAAAAAAGVCVHLFPPCIPTWPLCTAPSLQQSYLFGPWPIAAEEVFAASPHCFAFVNLKPVVPVRPAF